ncbi:T9SS type A sorting domain-containing protein [Chryseobacterium arthrosphaerae]|uniref:T9SS type A sorting domain-containing protein n=1 Tax=Chryseobacterium arthrosphaerae TaxID=651561 RepID=UPI0023E1F341|nr:T9SS type A sorting domain-containing protein [Chryseobacterium arthrosphaerae]WES98814.1 T9SS type A sorting domain-containing protein [Chryseobacterium arthrosphaerae]
MKKIMLSAAIIAGGLIFAQQITLDHTFPLGENVSVFPNGSNDIVYTAKGTGNILKIYNSAYSLVKTINVPVTSGYELEFYPSSDEPFMVSKYVFNTDDKLEFIVCFRSIANPSYRKMIIINEDGNIVKDFTTIPDFSWGGTYHVFHDPVSNSNKMMVVKFGNNGPGVFEVFSLPSNSTLSLKEVADKGKELSAFPIPANKVLNIINPSNGSSTVTIYDMTGKQVINKSFGSMNNQISVNVENLPKGTYFYKIGEKMSKFLKN